MLKRCPSCALEKPREMFRKRPERGPDAVRSKCADCEDRLRAEKRRAVPLEEQERALALARKWKVENRERNKATKAAWEAANPEKVKAYTQRIQAKWRSANVMLARARVLASHRKKPAYYRKATSDWAKANPHRARAKYKAYMARKRQAMPGWANEFFIEEAYHLAQLRAKVTGFPWHVDHIVPLQSETVCGLHTHDNLQVIPGVLNISKGNRYWPDMPAQEAS